MSDGFHVENERRTQGPFMSMILMWCGPAALSPRTLKELKITGCDNTKAGVDRSCEGRG